MSNLSKCEQSGQGELSIDELAQRINAAHAECESSVKTTIEKAIACGIALLAAKGHVEHGQWLPWLTAHCPAVAPRTAQAYMRIARNAPAVEMRNDAHLGVGAALKLLAEPRETKPSTGEPASVEEMLDQMYERLDGPLPDEGCKLAASLSGRDLIEVIASDHATHAFVSVSRLGGDDAGEQVLTKRPIPREYVHGEIKRILGDLLVDGAEDYDPSTLHWSREKCLEKAGSYFPGYVPEWMKAQAG